MWRPVMFRRLPKLRWVDPPQERIVPDELRNGYPALTRDLEQADTLIEEVFLPFDAEGLEAQNTFRREKLGLILLGLTVTVLGVVQAAAGGGVLWLGIVQGALAALAAWRAPILKRRNTIDRYFTVRKKAELLRGEYFLAVGKVGGYTGLTDPALSQAIESRVAAIRDSR
jgi:hypothetical protein